MRVAKVLVLAVTVALFMGCAKQKPAETAEKASETPQITMTEVTALGELITSPEEYVGKTLLIEGHVTGRCGGSGCWVSLDTGNPEKRLIVRTADESFIFPAECVDKDIQVQGVLMVRSADTHEHDAAEGEPDHECPDPEYYFHPQAMQIKA